MISPAADIADLKQNALDLHWKIEGV